MMEEVWKPSGPIFHLVSPQQKAKRMQTDEPMMAKIAKPFFKKFLEALMKQAQASKAEGSA